LPLREWLGMLRTEVACLRDEYAGRDVWRDDENRAHAAAA